MRTWLRNFAEAAAVIMTAAAFVVSCEPSTDWEIESAELLIPISEVDAKAGSQFIKVKGNGEWTISVLAEDSTAFSDWARVDQNTGKGDVAGITFSWDENTDVQSRRCRLVISGRNGNIPYTFIQAGAVQPTTLKSEPVRKWLELPSTNDKDLYFITHDMTLSGKTVRNYSFFYDTDALLARWVAYPLNKSLIATGNRSEAWALDPKLPRDRQAVLFSGFRTSTGGFGWDRGHQLPSADRYSPGANEATFYGTNMTPQRNNLNANAWAVLEALVRNWSYQCDTLYVVTGADITGSTDYAVDNDGKHVTVPVGYFKALVSYKKSQVKGYRGIAFYMEHKEYRSETDAVMACSMSIDELESKLGYDLFVNLPSTIDYAEEVESKVDSWWKDNSK